jgi:hypothetical protein
MLSSAQRYVAALIQGGKIEAMLKHGPVRHLFKGEEEKLWNYFDHHAKTYGTVPDFALSSKLTQASIWRPSCSQRSSTSTRHGRTTRRRR